MNLDLDGKVVIITGAAGGIGRATALAFAAEGANLGLVDRNRPRLAAVADKARAVGVKVEMVTADLATLQGIEDSIAELLAAHGGRVDVLVCAAGVLDLRSFDQVTWQDWEAGFRLHCLGPVWTAKNVLHVMRKQGSGRILMVISDLARQPEGIDPPYETAKGALLHATKLLARSEGPNGIRVNAVAPGPIDTPMIDPIKAQAARKTGSPPDQAIIEVLGERGQALGRLGRPEEVAALLVFLASQHAAFITGATYSIDGGTIRGLP
jgi:NAD(P)-dependent dehydrogenase (short-subunit alcohol dehydrogenase family)